jgi:hypothetical protein
MLKLWCIVVCKVTSCSLVHRCQLFGATLMVEVAVVSEMLVSIYRVSQKNCTVNVMTWSIYIYIYAIFYSKKIEVIEKFKFEINCLNIFETHCASQYSVTSHNTKVLIRKLHARWKLEDNIKMDDREMILGCEDYSRFQQPQRSATRWQFSWAVSSYWVCFNYSLLMLVTRCFWQRFKSWSVSRSVLTTVC